MATCSLLFLLRYVEGCCCVKHTAAMQYPGMQCNTDAHLHLPFCLGPATQCCTPGMQIAAVLGVCGLSSVLMLQLTQDCLVCMQP